MSLVGSLETAARAEDEVKGRGHELRGNGPAVSLKDDNSPPRPRASQAMLMRLVLVGRPSKEPFVIGGRPWGRVWAWRTAGIQPAKSRLTREGEKERERGE